MKAMTSVYYSGLTINNVRICNKFFKYNSKKPEYDSNMVKCYDLIEEEEALTYVPNFFIRAQETTSQP